MAKRVSSNNLIKLEKHDGVLVPVGKTMTIEQIANTALSQACQDEYRGEDIYLAGKNNLEAAICTLAEDAAKGLPDARRELLDRVLGKPLQRQDIRSQNLTLIGFLDQIAEEENSDGNSDV